MTSLPAYLGYSSYSTSVDMMVLASFQDGATRRRVEMLSEDESPDLLSSLCITITEHGVINEHEAALGVDRGSSWALLWDSQLPGGSWSLGLEVGGLTACEQTGR